MMDSLLAIIEIFANLTAFGERTDYFKQILIEAEILETTVSLMKLLKDTTDVLIEHKVYEPEEKFATFSSKVRNPHPFGGFLSRLARLIANLTYMEGSRSEAVFRKNKEYLGLVLSFTKLDEENPTLREWCLMIIRNLC